MVFLDFLYYCYARLFHRLFGKKEDMYNPIVLIYGVCFFVLLAVMGAIEGITSIPLFSFFNSSIILKFLSTLIVIIPITIHVYRDGYFKSISKKFKWASDFPTIVYALIVLLYVLLSGYMMYFSATTW